MYYYVYSAPTPGSVETLEAIVPGSVTSVALSPDPYSNRRFYFVTAEYQGQ